MVTISTRIKRHGDLLAIAGSDSMTCSVRSARIRIMAHEELDIAVNEIVHMNRASQGSGDRRKTGLELSL